MLEDKALEHERQTGLYIRPICLVQVERTGREQRGAGKIHAEDVREWLVGLKGVPPDCVAVKTSEKDELAAIDDAGGLLHPDCPVTFIITKQALQEGWDCSFAYVLAVLTNPGSKTALTQLVGRILRQPYAKKTGIPALDESYVFCFQRRGQDLLKEVREGFAAEGKLESLSPRPSLAKAAKRLVLPAFMVRDGKKEWRPAHYEADILARVPWENVDVSPLANTPLLERKDQDVVMRAGLDEHPLEDDSRPVRHKATTAGGELDYAFVAGHVLDAMPNPWRGFAVAKEVFTALLVQHPRERVVENFVFIVEELRKQLESERDRLAEQVFRDMLKRDELRFMVVTEDLGQTHGWPNHLPVKLEKKPGEKKATRTNGSQFELDLFAHVPTDSLGKMLEPEVATWLDEQEKLLLFWYRNRVKRDYAVQGWKRGRIFADFIFAAKAEGSEVEFDRVFVVETKGMHLKNSTDTNYKRSVFTVCSEHATRKNWADCVPAMRGTLIKFEVVDEEEWKKRLTGMLSA